MKNLTLLTFLISVLGFAQDKTPESFVDSNIERKLKDGTVQKFDGNSYKIVKRGEKKKKTEPSVVLKENTIHKKNAIKLFVGHGPGDIERRSNTRVDLENKAFFGLGYQRMLNENFSVEINGNTNESYSIGGGFHF
jgi:hypothetical protein